MSLGGVTVQVQTHLYVGGPVDRPTEDFISAETPQLTSHVRQRHCDDMAESEAVVDAPSEGKLAP